MTMRDQKTSVDPATLALQALAWAVGEPRVGPRLLDVTGLDVSELRARAGDPVLLAAVLGFLESHEPALLACAAALEVKPQALLTARMALDA